MNFIMVKGQVLDASAQTLLFGNSPVMSFLSNIRKLFTSARQLSPCIVFFDEIDALATRREWTEDGTGGINERVLSTLLNELDGVQDRQGVIVMACSSRPEKLDDALLRPGRFDSHLFVGLPTQSDRHEIVKGYAAGGKVALKLTESEFEAVAGMTVGFSGADIEALIR
eukprot:jgi/Hompol1/5995/HPOL_000160-RA